MVTIMGTLKPPEGPVVQHMLIAGSSSAAGLEGGESVLPKPFLEAVEQDAQKQQTAVQKYTKEIGNKTLFYVISKERLEDKPGYMVSYAWGNYRNDLVMTMFVRLMLLMVGLIVFSWSPCVWFARYLSRPLVQMERHVGRMAERDWHDPLETGRRDEIGRLGWAIEAMRRRLVKQDRTQQFFLQSWSHELKTPVMVIRSYAQSILDGVFPQGTLQESVGVIMKEAGRLEKRIRDLLYLNKMNYLSSREKAFGPFALKPLIEETVERLRVRRTDTAWELEVPDTVMYGEKEQWGVALENLLDNQLRYAKSRIRIVLTPGKGSGGTGEEGAGPLRSPRSGRNAPPAPSLWIWNDGPPLAEGPKPARFEPFASGADGEFGLGLAIVKQIAEYHGMAVRAANEAGGVAFHLEPKTGQGAAGEEKTA
ncbi:HAMP domain-containing histidine kinase [Paenibacillus sp. P25]|nr:HAMP domain-containing histidine kinase [Paenibacillus sp. P25]